MELALIQKGTPVSFMSLYIVHPPLIGSDR